MAGPDDSITTNASAPEEAAAPAEPMDSQRRHPRHPWRYRIEIAWLDHHLVTTPTMVDTLDLSAGGVGFFTRGMVQEGRTGVALIVRPQHDPMLRCFETCYCRYDQCERRYVVGARWISEPDIMPVEVHETATGPRIYVKPIVAQ